MEILIFRYNNSMQMLSHRLSGDPLSSSPPLVFCKFGSVFVKLYQTMIYSDKDMDAALDEYLAEANKLITSKQ